MQRKISLIIRFGKYNISVRAIEDDSNNKLLIFSDTQKISDNFQCISFITNSVNSINTAISGKITSAIVLVENNTSLHAELLPVEKELNLISGNVTKKDLESIFTLVKKDILSSEHDRSIIFIQPLQYKVIDVDSTEKAYIEFPLHKKGKLIKVRAIVHTIPTQKFNSIKEIVTGAGLVIEYYLTNALALAQETIAENTLKNGGVSVHIDASETHVTINYLNWTFKYHLINSGYFTILKKVSEAFNCTIEKAHELVQAYGELDKAKITIDKAIEISRISSQHRLYTISELSAILRSEMKSILIEARDFIASKTDISKFNIVLSGESNNFCSLLNFAKATMNLQSISLYKPLSYICVENKNIEYVGVLKYIDRYNKSIGNNSDATVLTNPRTLKFFPQRSRESFFKRVADKVIGRGQNAQQ